MYHQVSGQFSQGIIDTRLDLQFWLGLGIVLVLGTIFVRGNCPSTVISTYNSLLFSVIFVLHLAIISL